MISSKKGQRMIETITPIYRNSRIEQAIYEAIGSEFDDGDNLVEEVLLQLFPQTAAWGLVFWEQRLNISINLNEDIDKRRKKVITKLQTKYPITPERMASILKSYTGFDSIINEGVTDYIFEVILTSEDAFNINTENVLKIVNRIKPSHLGYNLGLQHNKTIGITEEFKRYVYDFPIAGIYCGTYPYSVQEARSFSSDIGIDEESNIEEYDYDIPLCGTIPYNFIEVNEVNTTIEIDTDYDDVDQEYKYASDTNYVEEV